MAEYRRQTLGKVMNLRARWPEGLLGGGGIALDSEDVGGAVGFLPSSAQIHSMKWQDHGLGRNYGLHGFRKP